MTVPCVSVVVPCYNVEGFLPETLNSLINQTLSDIEIVCVNDGSTDETLSVIRDYQQRDKRVVLVDGPNGGYGAAMNRGMGAARGTYIGIVESDDFVAPDMFEKLYAAATEYDADFVRSDFNKFWTAEDGTRDTVYEHLTTKKKLYNCVIDPQKQKEAFNAQMLNWTGIYKTEFLRAHDIRHNETPGAAYQDNGFWFMTYAYARRVVFLDEAFYFYRQDNAASSINQTDRVFTMMDEYAWIRQRLERDPEATKRWLGMYHYKKFHNLNFAFTLLAPELQMQFLERYSAEYAAAREAGELDRKLFKASEWKMLQQIIDDPAGYAEQFNKTRETKADEKEHLEAREKGKVALALYTVKRGGVGYAAKKAVNRVLRR